jgi:hypothetical protein
VCVCVYVRACGVCACVMCDVRVSFMWTCVRVSFMWTCVRVSLMSTCVCVSLMWTHVDVCGRAVLVRELLEHGALGGEGNEDGDRQHSQGTAGQHGAPLRLEPVAPPLPPTREHISKRRRRESL